MKWFCPLTGSAGHWSSSQLEADYDTATADDSAFYYAWSDSRNRMKKGNYLKNEANVRFSKIPCP